MSGLIDYLALLLERQAREEEAAAPDWSVLNREKTEGQAGTAKENGTAEMASAGIEAAVSVSAAAVSPPGGKAGFMEQERRAETPDFAEPLPGAATGISGGLAEAVRRIRGAERLYQQVRRSQAQAGYSRPVSGVTPLMVPGFQTETRGVSPEGLDRVFQRDARRYDGGFTLF